MTQQGAQMGADDLRRAVLGEYFAAQPDGYSKAAKTFETLLQMIEAGYWTPGDRIPTEKELVAILPVGLATVQNALGRLAQSGLIERRRKAGSFVSEPAAAGRELTYFVFPGEEGLLRVEDIELRILRIRDQGAWSSFIGPARHYICVERLMVVGQEFRIFSRIYLSELKFRPLLDMDVSALMDVTFRILFRDHFGVPPHRFERGFSFTRLSLELADRLRRPAGSTAIRDEVYQYTLRDEALFFMETIIPENGRVLKLGTPGAYPG
jgi:DNA-binding GntR family transcriptional regulator